MSTKRSARIHMNHDSNDIVSSMSYFVRNHSDSKQLFLQMQALHASGQLYEVSILSQCIIDECNDNIQNVDFFILSAQAEIETNGFTKNVEPLIRQALKLDPFNDVALAYFKLTTACADLKDGLYEKGEAALRDCLVIKSLRPYAGFFLAHHLFWKTNNLNEAIILLEETTRERESFLKAWADLALAYKRLGERVQANFALHRCLKIDREPTRRQFYESHLERQ